MFGRSYHLLTFAGFKICVDLSWIFIAILLSWTLASGYFPYEYPHMSPGTYWLMGVLGMLGLFVSIVLHELGHAVVARGFNVPIDRITLFLFGGVAELKKEPPSAKAEFLVAIAGPIVSVLIAVAMLFLTHLGVKMHWPITIIGVTDYLAFINVVVVIFNLLPAFPLDGGRVLRSILWGWKKDLAWATTICASLGSAFGFALIFLGILNMMSGNVFGGLWWMIIGLFLQNAATASRAQFYVSKGLRGDRVSRFMTKNPITVPPDITVKEFIDHFVYESHHHLYPITQGSLLLGYISLREVKATPQADWKYVKVKDAMVPASKFPTIDPNASGLDALNQLHQGDLSSLLVVRDGHLEGIVTAQDMFKLISLKLELEQGNP